MANMQVLWIFFVLFKFRKTTANSKSNKVLVKEQEKLIKTTRKETKNKSFHLEYNEDNVNLAQMQSYLFNTKVLLVMIILNGIQYTIFGWKIDDDTHGIFYG
jgi:hypothetical protein